MGALKLFIIAVDSTNEWVGRVVKYLIFIIFFLLFVEVIRRYIFGDPTVWQGELAQLIFGVYAIMSGGAILKAGGHVNVDILHAGLSPRGKAICDIITSGLFFLFVGMMVYMGWDMAMESISRWETSESVWNPYVWPVKLAIPVGSALLFLQGIVKLIYSVCDLFGIEPPVKRDTQEGEESK